MNTVMHNLINITLSLFMSFILVLILFFQNIKYVTKKTFLLSNIEILLILIAVMLLCMVLCCFYKKNQHNFLSRISINPDKLAKNLSISLFFVQCYIFYNIFFLTGWDVSSIRGMAQAILSEDQQAILRRSKSYFSAYPNNLLLVYLNTIILKINSAIGVFPGDYSMMSGVIVNCLLNSSACYLVYKILLLFTEKRFAFIGFLLSVLSFGISPWTVIFYSDSVGLIFPILSFYLYIKPTQKKTLCCLLKICAVFTAVAGYFIKPQCAVILIAFILIETIDMFRNFKLSKIKKPMLLALSALLFFAIITPTINYTAKKSGLSLDSEKAFGLSHFLMMGLNEERNGVYSQEDVHFSSSFVLAEDRKTANLEEAAKRMEEMGLDGIFEHICKKMLTVFNDGTFAWNVEGTFYHTVPKDLNNSVSPFLKSIYHEKGSRHDDFHLFAQIIWIIILIFVAVSALYKTDETNLKYVSILRLAIIGLILFEILFEVRARYLYIYLPVFCVLAGLGISKIFSVINTKTNLILSKRGN